MRRLKLALSFAVLTALVGVAEAADLPREVSPVPARNWTGFYAGAQLGYQWGSQSTIPVFNNLSTFQNFGLGQIRPDGVVGGAHAGFNYQINQFVLGIEGDVEGANVSDTLSGPVTSRVYQTLNWQASARSRVGYLFDNLLIYATGGVSFGQLYTRYSQGSQTQALPFGFVFNFPGFSARNSEVLGGWTVGAGGEYAFNENWTGRLEYRYTELPWSIDSTKQIVTNARVQSPSFQTIRLGVSYKF